MILLKINGGSHETEQSRTTIELHRERTDVRKRVQPLI